MTKQILHVSPHIVDKLKEILERAHGLSESKEEQDLLIQASEELDTTHEIEKMFVIVGKKNEGDAKELHLAISPDKQRLEAFLPVYKDVYKDVRIEQSNQIVWMLKD